MDIISLFIIMCRTIKYFDAYELIEHFYVVLCKQIYFMDIFLTWVYWCPGVLA